MIRFPPAKADENLADPPNPMTDSGSQPDLLNMERRLAWLTRLLGVGVLALVAVTWKLWTPQDVFPRVPLFRWAPPDWWDWLSLGLIVIGGLGLGVGPSCRVRRCAATLACGLAIAFLCDQHRLQPWAWQFFILALLITLADKPLQWHGWQWLTISIYFYSALSKFDARFLDSMGHSFARTAFGGFFAGNTSGIPPGPSTFYSINYAVVWLFPIGELTVAILLAVPRSRNWGMWAAVGMHAMLLQILGPFGLNHSFGVLGWNILFIAQNVLLFMSQGNPWGDHPLIATNESPQRSFRIKKRLAQCLLGWVLVWPATYSLGLCDPWIAWAVYVEPYQTAVVNVPEFEIREAVFSRSRVFDPSEHVNEFPIGRWSLHSLHVPAYPSLRSSFAAALEVSERFAVDDVSLRLFSRTREIRSAFRAGENLANVSEIHAYARRFWFNAYPTSMYRRAARERALKHDG